MIKVCHIRKRTHARTHMCAIHSKNCNLTTYSSVSTYLLTKVDGNCSVFFVLHTSHIKEKFRKLEIHMTLR